MVEKTYKPLVKGDVVELVAPATGCTKDEYERCAGFIRSWGLEPKARVYEEVIRAEEYFCSNTDDYRFNHLYDALTAKDSAAVWCITGGYGSPRLLDRFYAAKQPRRTKLFIGFSDITTVLNPLVDKWHWPVIHGPMLVQMVGGKVSPEGIERIKALVFGTDTVTVPDMAALNDAARNGGVIAGQMVGGCLSLLQVLIGTKQQIKLTGKILLLEDDRFETPHRVDRIIDHMARAKMFDNIAAVVLGNFLEEDQGDAQKAAALAKALEHLREQLDRRNVPLVQHRQLGHALDMIPVPLGTNAVLTLGGRPSLVLNSGVKR